MQQTCRKIAESSSFEGWIITLIVLNALCLGAETVPELTEHYDTFIWAVLWGSQIVFVIELAIRIGAYNFHLKEFFKDFWNGFDFIVVVASFLPAIGIFATVARVLRVLRVLRIMTVSDELRLFLDQMRASFDIFLFAGIIWLIFAYVYGIAGFYLFGEIDSTHWGTLGLSLKTVFNLSLLQSVDAILSPLWAYSSASILYFFAFFGGLFLLAGNVIGSIVVRKGGAK